MHGGAAFETVADHLEQPFRRARALADALEDIDRLLERGGRDRRLGEFAGEFRVARLEPGRFLDEPGAIVVSVAAGVTIASLEALLPEGVAVLRAMPNTPSLIGRGITGIAAGGSAGPEAVETVERLFSTVGEVLVVREDQINAVTAISGSGPAYLFLYAEEMTGAARRPGFHDAQAALLVQQTIAGAAELMIRSDKDPAQLRRDVTSPKGTTERAVEVLQAAGWGELFDRALAANIRRSEELEAGD